MSRAFSKEQDDQNLGDISPTVKALIVYLTRENNGIRVYEKRSYVDSQGRTIHEMNNGFSYTIDVCSRWSVL